MQRYEGSRELSRLALGWTTLHLIISSYCRALSRRPGIGDRVYIAALWTSAKHSTQSPVLGSSDNYRSWDMAKRLFGL